MNFKMYEYKGVIHIHSKYSDGSASVKKIVKSAQDASLDYVILTDHDNLQALKYGYEGWHENLLLLVSEEITPRDGNHYLALGIEEEIVGKCFSRVEDFVNKVSQQGAIGIIAHPFGSKNRSLRGNKNCWNNWNVKGYNGMEIWSYMIDWIENVNPLTLFYYYFSPDKAIDGPNSLTLKKWDEIAQSQYVVGIGSIDAHGIPVPIFRFFLKSLSYRRLFETIRTHILTPVPLSRQFDSESKLLVYEAIRNGRCFVAYDFLADSMGFSFTGLMGETTPLLMGNEINLDGKVLLHASTPIPAELRLIHNGEQIKNKHGKDIKYETNQAGVYRVEVYYNNRPWIFSNPIFLR